MRRRSGPSVTPSSTSTSGPPERRLRTTPSGRADQHGLVDRGEDLAEWLGLPIRNRRLLAPARTHRSWAHEHPDDPRGHNERLEFLVDAVVNLAIAAALYARHPEEDEGV